MTLTEVLKLIIAKSSDNALQAVKALRSAEKFPHLRKVQSVLEHALADPSARFTDEERDAIASHLMPVSTMLLSVRITADQNAELRHRADEADMTVSDYVRQQLFGDT